VADALAAAGPGRHAVLMGGIVHVVVERADRQGAQLLTVDPDGPVRLGAPLPLGVVSGVAASAGRLLVGGAEVGSGAPVVCVEVTGGWATRALPGSRGAAGAVRPVVAWPLPVAAADGPWVIWAAGAPPRIEAARVVGDRLAPVRPTIQAGRVFGLQAAAPPGGGVDVWWQDAGGDRWQRLPAEPGPGSGAASEPASVPPRSTLVDGAILSPLPGGRVAVLDTSTGARRELDLPSTPVDADSGVDWVDVPAGEPGFLIWTRRGPVEHGGPGGALAAPVRTFVARRAGGTLANPVEVPGGARCVVAVGDRVLAFPAAGILGWSVRP
jgi:hypothetical protein